MSFIECVTSILSLMEDIVTLLHHPLRQAGYLFIKGHA